MRALRRFVIASVTILLGALAGHLAGCQGDGPKTGFVDSNDLPEGGVRVYPNTVTCGVGICEIATSAGCCTGPGAGSSGEKCAEAGCPPNTGLVACNEQADCAVGTVCCASFSTGDGGGYPSAQCAATCPAPGMQLCRTNGECGSDKCVVQTCSDGHNYEMCGLSTSAAFPCTTPPATED